MDEDTRENIKMTRKKVMECSLSETGECMRVNGKMASSMAKEFSERRICPAREFGRTGRG